MGKRKLQRGAVFLILFVLLLGVLAGCQAPPKIPETPEELRKTLMGTYRATELLASSVWSSTAPDAARQRYIGVELILEEDFYLECFESGTFSGSPQIIVRELEDEDRSRLSKWYSSALDYDGDRYLGTASQQGDRRFAILVNGGNGESLARFFYAHGQLYWDIGVLMKLEKQAEAPDWESTRLFDGVEPACPVGELLEYRGGLYRVKYPSDWSLNGGKYPQTSDPWIRLLFHEDEPYLFLSGRTERETLTQTETEPGEHWAERFELRSGETGLLFCSRIDEELRIQFRLELPEWKTQPYRLAIIRMDWDCFQENREEILWFLKGIELT